VGAVADIMPSTRKIIHAAMSEISKEYRSQAIGKLLVQKCKSLAKRKKCYRITLESRNDRIDAHNFYKKIGFQQIAQVFEKKLCK
jgi:ribosomal protein S18 acetylase RimI-like enzyme